MLSESFLFFSVDPVLVAEVESPRDHQPEKNVERLPVTRLAVRHGPRTTEQQVTVAAHQLRQRHLQKTEEAAEHEHDPRQDPEVLEAQSICEVREDECEEECAEQCVAAERDQQGGLGPHQQEDDPEDPEDCRT